VKHTTIRSVLSIVTTESLHLKQLDVKTVFLLEDLKDINILDPQGAVTPCFAKYAGAGTRQESAMHIHKENVARIHAKPEVTRTSYIYLL